MDTLEKRSSSIELAPPTHRQVIPKPGRGRFPILKQVKDRFRRTEAPRTEQSMLPMLIEVFAGFTNLDGYIGEEEVDSILGFLRYDYPETVYSELRKLFIRSLGEEHDLEQIAGELSKSLPVEEKFLLGVQLYVLISRAGLPKENLITFYQFMTNLGVASEAINIVYQLNTNDQNPNVSEDDAERAAESAQRLETVLFSTESEDADVMLLGAKDESVTLGAFRYQDLLLVKNIGKHPIIARGRQLGEGEFCRVFEGQRILAGEEVLTFQDLIFYLNAKKDVSSVKVFLAQDNAGNQIIEKSKSKFSYLRVIFGLKIEASVIAQTDAKIAGKSMEIGSRFEVHPNEIVEFTDYSSITFADLRKRAKELGGRFSLQPNRRDYLVSDNPKNLRPGDLLLSPGAAGEILLKIECNEQRTAGEMFVLKSEREITVENQPVRDQISLADGSIISIGEGQYLRCHFADGIIEEERNVINQLKVRDVGHSYDRKVRALDSVSLSIQRGEMVCVMGPSGCGKSTLLKTIAGQLKPAEGKIRLNGVSLYDELESLTPYIAFVPQDETFDSLLTVEENMDTAAAIRAPHFTTEERRRRADARLVELGLNELRHRIAGDEQKKNLSGGQRRRLNAGMDMIGIADVYLFDEPTSGLSSKDSEHVLEMIRGLTHNRITLVSIHQPSSRLFQMFDKVVLLDNGGKLAFFGTPTQMLEYFYEARVQEGIDATAYPMPESR
ncbi:MAG: ABC transporter ATP-binding protein, partial [Verrucomicrobiota bacterium]